MNTIFKQNSLVKDLIVLGAIGLFFIGIPLGLIGVLVYFDLSYVVPAAIAIIAFVTSVSFTFRQKCANTISIVTFTVGLLFLVSSLIEFGFAAFAQNMSIHDQIEFSGIMRPEQISHGLASIGAGIIFILISFRNIKSSSLLKGNDSAQSYKILKVVWLCAGIFFLLFGIYIFINGLRPL